MTLLHKRLLMGGFLCCALSLPSAWAISGCSNQYLQGTYNLQIDNASVINTLNAFNAASSSTGIAGATASNASVTAPGQVDPVFPGSFTDSAPYLGRFYFDGNGNVVGMENSRSSSGGLSPVNVVVGSYSVDSGCNATIGLIGGRHYTAVLADQGQNGVFVETDEAGYGATGTLQRSAPSCSNPTTPQSMAFRYSGTTLATSISTGLTVYQPYASIGTLSLDGAGNFTMNSTILSAGATQTLASSGSYTVGGDCSIHLNFASNANLNGAVTGAYEAPSVFSGLLSGTSGGGLLSVQPANGTSFSGLVIAQ